MKLIDTHSHVNFNAYRDDSEEIIKKALDNDTWVINVGSQLSTSRRAVKMAENYDEGVYAAVGIHPVHLMELHVDEDEVHFESRAEELDYDIYKELAQNKKVVAIGEVGLDYHRISDMIKEIMTNEMEQKIKEKQKEVFIKQFELAQELELPMIIHCRDAHEDMIELIKKLKIHHPHARGVIHCFTDGYEIAKQYFELGFMISFTGIVTFAKGFEWIKDIPEDRFMIETDAPYLTPIPHRGQRNEPVYVQYVASKIAQFRCCHPDEIAKITTRNARKFFNI